jgi:hypothetical protein
MITAKEILEKRESIKMANLEAAQAKEKAEKEAMAKFIDNELDAIAAQEVEKIGEKIINELVKNPMKVQVYYQYNGKYPLLVGEEIKRKLIDLEFMVRGEFDNGFTTQYDRDGFPHSERTGEYKYLLRVEI